MLAEVRPRMQAAGLQCLKLQIAVAFPGTELSRKTRSPNYDHYYSLALLLSFTTLTLSLLPSLLGTCAQI